MNAEGVVRIAGEYIHYISLYPKVPVFEICRGTSIQALYQLLQQLGSGDDLISVNGDNVLLKFYRVSDTVQTGNGSDDKDITSSG